MIYKLRKSSTILASKSWRGANFGKSSLIKAQRSSKSLQSNQTIPNCDRTFITRNLDYEKLTPIKKCKKIGKIFRFSTHIYFSIKFSILLDKFIPFIILQVIKLSSIFLNAFLRFTDHSSLVLFFANFQTPSAYASTPHF